MQVREYTRSTSLDIVFPLAVIAGLLHKRDHLSPAQGVQSLDYLAVTDALYGGVIF